MSVIALNEAHDRSDPLEIAADLLAEISAVFATDDEPADQPYINAVISLGFAELASGLRQYSQADKSLVLYCADTIRECEHLSAMSRHHISHVLRCAAGGHIAPEAAAFVLEASMKALSNG